MARPKLFVGSSSESLPIAYAVQENLEDFEVTVWTQALFQLSRGILEELVRFAGESDAAVMVFSNDDVAEIRGETLSVTRDNVIFELGLFLGALGRDRAFVIAPKGADLHLPSDLAGVLVARYDSARADKSWTAATGPACNRIRETFKTAAPTQKTTVAAAATEASFESALNWLLNQLSSPEREALAAMCNDGVLEYTEGTKNRYKPLRNYGLARTVSNRSMRNDHQLVPTPFGLFVGRFLKSTT